MRATASLTVFLLGTSLAVLPLSSLAQGTDSHAPPNTAHIKRIEGTIVRVDANELLLRAKGGTTETYQLSPTAQLARARLVQMSDLTAGKLVGCINLYGQSERKVAGECSILPDGLHALVENHGDAASPESAWISGRITAVRDGAHAAGEDHGVTIQITDGGHATDMNVTPVTKVTILSAADASALKVGARVRGVSQQAVDGTGVIQTLTVMSAVARDSQ